MPTMYLRGFALRDAETDAASEGPIPFVLATEGRKGDGIDLSMGNVDLARFESNPILGYGHDYWGRNSLPIGRVDDARVDGARLVGDLNFDPADEFAVKVEGKVRNRYLNAVSVGFDAMDIDEDGVPGKWVLYEVSVVPLPMDPDAVAEDGGRSLALARMFGGDLAEITRAGKVLSKKNLGLVESAYTALGALMEAARKEDEAAADEADSDDEARGIAERDMRLRSLDLAQKAAAY